MQVACLGGDDTTETDADASAPRMWEPRPGASGTLDGPTRVRVNAEITLTASGSDSDAWVSGASGERSGIGDDPVTYTWSAASGAFPYGSKGASVVWRAGQTTGHVEIACTIDDAGELPPGDQGMRDDGPLLLTHPVTVWKISALRIRRHQDGWPKSYADSCVLAAGGKPTDAHRADVEMLITPPLQGVMLDPPRIVGEGSDGVVMDARLSMGPMETDAEGRVEALNAYTSSDYMAPVRLEVESGSGVLAVPIEHAWHQNPMPWDGDHYFSENTPCPVSYSLYLKNQGPPTPIRGHLLEFTCIKALVWHWNPGLLGGEGDYGLRIYTNRITDPSCARLAGLVRFAPDTTSDTRAAGVYATEMTVSSGTREIVDGVLRYVTDCGVWMRTIDQGMGSGTAAPAWTWARPLPPLPGSGTRAALPPPMPERFDAATVKRLVGEIDEGRNAAVLKMGYFLSRAPHALRQTGGLDIVREAASREPAGTRRWFLLKGLIGMAGLHIAPETRSEGYDAYEEIVAHAGDAEKAGAEDVLLRSIQELAAAIAADNSRTTSGLDRQPDFALLRALHVYLNYVARTGKDPCRIPWQEALYLSPYRTDVGREYADRVLAAAGTNAPYALLRLAAELQAGAPDRGIEILKQARGLLPDEDPAEVAWYFDTLVAFRVSAGDLVGAIATQEERIRLTDRGRGALAALLSQHGDAGALGRLLPTLLAPDAPEAEVNEAASALITLFKTPGAPKRWSAGELAAMLLSSYLESPRPRDATQEMIARVNLGGYFLQTGKLDEANGVLEPGQLPRNLASEHAQFLRRRAGDLRQRIARLQAGATRTP